MNIVSTKNNWSLTGFLTACFVLFPLITRAHEGGHAGEGFVSGFLHPVTGADHVVAMVAVGLWGGILGKPAIWILPVTFPVVMALGGMLGIADVPLAFVEPGIALSGIILGLMVLLIKKVPFGIAAVLVGLFGLFHGYAHGVELPRSAAPLAYSIGFVISTGILHLIGIALGLLLEYSWGKPLVRFLGAAITITGVYFMITIF